MDLNSPQAEKKEATATGTKAIPIWLKSPWRQAVREALEAWGRVLLGGEIPTYYGWGWGKAISETAGSVGAQGCLVS